VFDYTYDGVMRSLEHSHLRLGLAKIDIALVHDVDFWTIKDRAILDQRFKTVMDRAFKALDELRRAGVIGAIGRRHQRSGHQPALHPGRRLRLHAAGRPLHPARAGRARGRSCRSA
jgi:aryl-alcohol dehydrogenase-like predicted oxidoreductase